MYNLSMVFSGLYIWSQKFQVFDVIWAYWEILFRCPEKLSTLLLDPQNSTKKSTSGITKTGSPREYYILIKEFEYYPLIALVFEILFSLLMVICFGVFIFCYSEWIDMQNMMTFLLTADFYSKIPRGDISLLIRKLYCVLNIYCLF